MNSARRPWWLTSLLGALGTVAVAAAVLYLPWGPGLLLLVIGAGAFVFILVRNPAYWRRRLAASCLAGAVALAITPAIKGFLAVGSLGAVLIDTGSPPVLAGLFLLASLGFVGFETWVERGPGPTKPSASPIGNTVVSPGAGVVNVFQAPVTIGDSTQGSAQNGHGGDAGVLSKLSSVERERQEQRAAARLALIKLLVESFGVDELRATIELKVADGERVSRLIEWKGPVASVMKDVCGELEKNGLVDPAFFAVLVSERPKLKEPIKEVAALWGVLASNREREQDKAATRSSERVEQRIALMLDRTLYWKTLKDACESDEPVIATIIHGASHQNLGLFLKRVQRYFNSRTGRRHRTVAVDSDRDFQRTATPEDWGARIRSALGVSDLSLSEALEYATEHEAAMLIFSHGSGTLRQRGDGESVGLDDDEQRGFVEFIRSYLPDAIQEAELAHPLRIVVPIEYPPYEVEADDPLYRGVCDAMEAALGVKFVPVQALSLPSWEDVWESIKAEFKLSEQEPPAGAGARCKSVYDECMANKCSFAELAAAIGEALKIGEDSEA